MSEKKKDTSPIEADVIDPDFAWLARSFGRTNSAPLTLRDLEAFHRAAEYVEYGPGTHLFREGDQATSCFLVRSGRVDLYREDRGHRCIFAQVKPGEVAGDSALFRRGRHVASARVAGSVSALRLRFTRLLPLLHEHPMIAMRWIVATGCQSRAAERRQLALSHVIREQIAEFLINEADRFGHVHLSQSRIADILCAARQSVNGALGELCDAGIVRQSYRLVRVIDRERLEKLSA